MSVVRTMCRLASMRSLRRRARCLFVGLVGTVLAVATSPVGASLQVAERSPDTDAAVTCTPVDASPDGPTAGRDHKGLEGPRVAARQKGADAEHPSKPERTGLQVCPLPPRPQPEPVAPRARP